MKLSNHIYEGCYFRNLEWNNQDKIFNEGVLDIEKFYFYKYIVRTSDNNKNDANESWFILSIEPTEITFIENFENNSYSQVLLKIPFVYHHDSIQEYNQRVLDFISHKYEFLLKGFLQDLFIYNYFENTGRIAEIKDLVLGIPILNGLSYKYGFEGIYDEVVAKDGICNCSLCNKADDDESKEESEINDGKENIGLWDQIKNKLLSSVEWIFETLMFWLVKMVSKFPNEYLRETLLRGQKTSQLKCIYSHGNGRNIRVEKMLYFYNNYIRFITEHKNEIFFRVRMDNPPFKSTDGEIIEAQKKMSAFDGDKVVADTMDSSICQYFIGRYGLFEGIGKTPFLVFVSVISVALTILCIGMETISFNIDMQLKFSELLLPVLLLICIFVLPVFFSFGSRAFPHIILPRLVVAIFSGWLIFLSAEEIMKIDYSLRGVNLFFICSAFVIFLIIFLLNEIKNSAISLSKRLIWARAAQIFSISLIISYAIGFFVMSYVNNKFLGLDSFIVSNSRMQKGQTLRLDLWKNEEKFLDLVNSSKNDIQKLTNETKKHIESEKLIKKGMLYNLGYKTTIDNSYLKAIDHYWNNQISDSGYGEKDTLKSIIVSDTSSYDVLPEFILKKCKVSMESRDSIISSIDSILINNVKLTDFKIRELNFKRLSNKANFEYYVKPRLKLSLKKMKDILSQKNELDQVFDNQISKLSLFNVERQLKEVATQYTKDTVFLKSLYYQEKDSSKVESMGHGTSILNEKLMVLISHFDSLNYSNSFAKKISNLEAIVTFPILGQVLS